MWCNAATTHHLQREQTCSLGAQLLRGLIASSPPDNLPLLQPQPGTELVELAQALEYPSPSEAAGMRQFHKCMSAANVSSIVSNPHYKHDY
jgi:hypothetical protein